MSHSCYIIDALSFILQISCATYPFSPFDFFPFREILCNISNLRFPDRQDVSALLSSTTPHLNLHQHFIHCNYLMSCIFPVSLDTILSPSSRVFGYNNHYLSTQSFDIHLSLSGYLSSTSPLAIFHPLLPFRLFFIHYSFPAVFHPLLPSRLFFHPPLLFRLYF